MEKRKRGKEKQKKEKKGRIKVSKLQEMSWKVKGKIRFSNP